MTDENDTTPAEETPGEEIVDSMDQNPPEETTAPEPPEEDSPEDLEMNGRLERLGGEPAPVITPDEFARLQRAGQVYIDARGRVRTSRRSDAEAGVSLRKRRAWYQ